MHPSGFPRPGQGSYNEWEEEIRPEVWGELKGSSLRRGGQGSARGEPWSGGGCRRAPLAETAGAGGPALQQRPWPGRALLLLPSGLPPGPWWLHPTRTNQWGRGPAPLGSPLQGKGELLWEHSLAGHTWWGWRSLALGAPLSPAKDASSKTVFLCFGWVQVHDLSGRSSGNARWRWLWSCLPCSSSSTWFSAPTAAERSQLETEPRGLGSISRQAYTFRELIVLLSRQASLLKDINSCLLSATNCLRHFRNSGHSLLTGIWSGHHHCADTAGDFPVVQWLRLCASNTGVQSPVGELAPMCLVVGPRSKQINKVALLESEGPQPLLPGRACAQLTGFLLTHLAQFDSPA